MLQYQLRILAALLLACSYISFIWPVFFLGIVFLGTAIGVAANSIGLAFIACGKNYGKFQLDGLPMPTFVTFGIDKCYRWVDFFRGSTDKVDVPVLLAGATNQCCKHQAKSE